MIRTWPVLLGIVVIALGLWFLAGGFVLVGTGLAAPLAASSVVDVRLLPATTSVAKGANFTLDIQVEPNGQEIQGVDAMVNFNPSHLQVVSVVMSGTSPLNLELLNTFDNAQGTVDLSAGKLTGTGPTTTFTMATITFQAQQVDLETLVTLSDQFPRETIASIGGEEVQRSLFGSTVTIGTPTPPPTATLAPTATATSAPVATPTATLTPTATATSAPVATPTATLAPTPMSSTLPSPTATPIPGLTGWGLVVAAMLLTVLAYLTLRHKPVPE